jgi:hypothetical protein
MAENTDSATIRKITKVKLSYRLLYYLELFIANLFIPILLGTGLVILFKQHSEFILLGIILGGVLIQFLFFFKIIKRHLTTSIFLGIALFILVMGLTLFLERFSVVASFLGAVSAKTDNIWGEMFIYSAISIFFWELVYRFRE